MSENEAMLLKERDRLLKRLDRERAARAEAEAIAERAIRDLAEANADLEGQVRQAILERQARINAILDSTVDAIITINTSGIIEQANPATETLFGYPPSELVGRNVSILMPKRLGVHHDQFIRNYLESGEAKIIGKGRETVAQRKDGTTFPIDLAIGEVRLAEKRLFTGVIRDISERRAAQSRQEETLLEVQRSRDDLLAVLQQTRAGSMLIDARSQVTFVSDGGGAVRLPDAEVAVGRSWNDVLPMSHRDKLAFRRMMERSGNQRARLDMEWKDRTGKPCHVEVELKDDPRDTEARIAFFYDVTELHELRQKVASSTHGQMVGNSPVMHAVYTRIAEVARGDWTVLIEGETGAGKELVARAIHAASARKDGPFVAVNCGGLTETLLESQLFGHVRGAFTGAVSDRPGFFESASGGTLLLDEMGEISTKLQTTLLRVIQEREVTRVGDTRARPVDVRILAATHRDLAAEVVAGRFRQDLLYRIRVARVFVPPLRERGDDILLLAMGFLADLRLSSGKPIIDFDEQARTALVTHVWPGNVRELRSAVEYAVIGCATDHIRLSDLPPEVQGAAQPPAHWPPPRAAAAEVPLTAAATAEPRMDGFGYGLPPAPPQRSAQGDERAQILAALEWAEGNRARAARCLGIGRATLYRRMHALGITVSKS